MFFDFVFSLTFLTVDWCHNFGVIYLTIPLAEAWVVGKNSLADTEPISLIGPYSVLLGVVSLGHRMEEESHTREKRLPSG